MSWLGLGGLFAKRSTPAERLVIVWLLILIALGLGVVCLYFGYTAAADKAAEAEQLRVYGFALLGVGLGIWLIHRLVAWVVDR